MSRGRPDANLIWRRYGWLYKGARRRAVDALERHVRGQIAAANDAR